MYILYINIYVVWPNTQEKNSSSVKQKTSKLKPSKPLKLDQPRLKKQMIQTFSDLLVYHSCPHVFLM